MDIKYSIIITTTATPEEADKIAKALLEGKFAACVQASQIKSYFPWKGEISMENEYVLTIKSKESDFKEIEKCIKENHSYDIPEIIQIPVTNGSDEYLRWISEITN